VSNFCLGRFSRFYFLQTKDKILLFQFNGLEIPIYSGMSIPGSDAYILGLTALSGDRGPAIYRAQLGYPGQPIGLHQALVAPSTNDGLRVYAMTGAAVPGAVPGAVSGTVFAGGFAGIERNSANRYGDFVFSASMMGGDSNTANYSAIWYAPHDEAVQMVVRMSNPSPISGLNYSVLGGLYSYPFIYLSDEGDIFFNASVAGAGVLDINRSAIFRIRDNVHTLIARIGVPMNGLPSGVTLSNSNQSFGNMVRRLLRGV